MTDQIREEAYRAAASAVDRFLGRIDDSAAERVEHVGTAGWNRFRAEMSRVVDLNLDMVRDAFGLYAGLLSPESLRDMGGRDVLALGPALAGSEASAILWLHNFDDDPIANITLVGSALALRDGDGIKRPKWSFHPSSVDVPARSAVPVVVGLAVPGRTSAGTYEGSVGAGAGDDPSIEVRLDVVEQDPIAHEEW